MTFKHSAKLPPGLTSFVSVSTSSRLYLFGGLYSKEKESSDIYYADIRTDYSLSDFKLTGSLPFPVTIDKVKAVVTPKYVFLVDITDTSSYKNVYLCKASINANGSLEEFIVPSQPFVLGDQFYSQSL